VGTSPPSVHRPRLCAERLSCSGVSTVRCSAASRWAARACCTLAARVASGTATTLEPSPNTPFNCWACSGGLRATPCSPSPHSKPSGGGVLDRFEERLARRSSLSQQLVLAVRCAEGHARMHAQVRLAARNKLTLQTITRPPLYKEVSSVARPRARKRCMTCH
jgi:hypothetical protein